eukprot:scaffold368_cov258-Pinguiococcus_pyrenoidosus.AAC.51
MDANRMQPGMARGMHSGPTMHGAPAPPQVYGDQMRDQYGTGPSPPMMPSGQSSMYAPPQGYDRRGYGQQGGSMHPAAVHVPARPMEQPYGAYPPQPGRGMEMMNDHTSLPMMHGQHQLHAQQHVQAPSQAQQIGQASANGMMMAKMHMNSGNAAPMRHDSANAMVAGGPDYGPMGMQGMHSGGGLPGQGVPGSAGMPMSMASMSMSMANGQGYPGMASMPYPMFSMGKHEAKVPVVEKRKGKWTVEEEDYVMKIIELFNRGLLSAPEGTTLRAYLADALNCDPMRITKKFTGTACLGKRVYHSAEQNSVNAEEIEKAKEELSTLETRFKTRLERNRRKDQCKKNAFRIARVSWTPSHQALCRSAGVRLDGASGTERCVVACNRRARHAPGARPAARPPGVRPLQRDDDARDGCDRDEPQPDAAGGRVQRLPGPHAPRGRPRSPLGIWAAAASWIRHGAELQLVPRVRRIEHASGSSCLAKQS